MAQTPKTRFIKHIVNGGWKPDAPQTVDVTPDQANRVFVPHLIAAENILYQLDGGVRKAFGTTALMAALSETNVNVKGLYDFWRSVGANPQQHRILHLDDAIYKDDGDESFATIKTGLTNDAVPNYSQFDDLLIISSDASADVPFSWDGTTFQNLAGSPPNFAFSTVHSAHVFAAGVDANPSTLYYSVPNDPEDWTGAGSGSIQIDPNDGDRITGMISFKGNLIVFKGPYKGSIHIITGTSNTDFARRPLQRGIGAVWQNAITPYRDDIAFMWSDGHIYTLGATASFGDFRLLTQLTGGGSSFIQGRANGSGLSDFISGRVNFSKLRHVTMANNPALGALQVCIPIDSSSQPNFILHVDYRFEEPRMSAWFDYDGYTCVALVIDPDSNDQPIFMYGGNDKRVWKGEQATRLNKGSEQITATLTMPHFDYASAETLKTFAFAGVGVRPLSDNNFTFGWTRDANAEQTVTLSQGGSDVLSPAAANEFTLGTSTLGGGRYDVQWVDIHNGGQFRSISYRVSSTDGDFEVDNVVGGYHIDGVSMEND